MSVLGIFGFLSFVNPEHEHWRSQPYIQTPGQAL